MEERILGLAAEITGEEPTELLKTLCLSAEAAWRSRLRPEAVEWEDALCCAAAFTAALMQGKNSMEAHKAACRVSAWVCTFEGAMPNLHSFIHKGEA